MLEAALSTSPVTIGEMNPLQTT
ncbi:unnamed protein product [Calypogeia fissa]